MSTALANKARNMVASTHVARPDSHDARGRAQSRARARRRAWDRRSARSRAAARRRRRGLGQDGDAGASGGGAYPRRRRSEAHHARHLLPPRGGGAGPAGRAAARPASRARGGRRGDAGLCRHVPRHRRPAPARICAPARPRSAVHHPRPRGFGRPHELGAARSGLGETKDRFPTKATCLAIYSRVVNARGELKANARQMVSLGRGARGRPCARCSQLTSR